MLKKRDELWKKISICRRKYQYLKKMTKMALHPNWANMLMLKTSIGLFRVAGFTTFLFGLKMIQSFFTSKDLNICKESKKSQDRPLTKCHGNWIEYELTGYFYDLTSRPSPLSLIWKEPSCSGDLIKTACKSFQQLLYSGWYGWIRINSKRHSLLTVFHL